MGNKTYILRFRAVNRDIFEAIRSGKKKIETRAATVKYKNIKKGDVLVFVCGNKRFSRIIKEVKFFKSVGSMLKVFKVQDIMPNLDSKADLERAYFSYPGYKEKIKKFGLIAFKIN
jgi:ASC-1-like (ASCH) protein